MGTKQIDILFFVLWLLKGLIMSESYLLPIYLPEKHKQPNKLAWRGSPSMCHLTECTK